MEKTLVLIKPNAYENALEIINIYRKYGFKIEDYKAIKFSTELAKEHYSEHVEKPFYPNLESFMTSGPVEALIISGKNIVERVRKLNGATNPEKAEEGTIRKIYGIDGTRNAVHASDSKENGIIESNRFFNNPKVESIRINCLINWFDVSQLIQNEFTDPIIKEELFATYLSGLKQHVNGGLKDNYIEANLDLMVYNYALANNMIKVKENELSK